MADYYLGQIIQGGWNFAPQGTLLCAGQLLSIQQNAALFALLGVQFGGNGVQTFGIPDLRGRTMLGAGTSTTHTTYIIGQSAGVETVTLTPSNIPPHNHAATFADHGSSFSVASARASTAQAATGSVLGRAADGAPTPTSQPEIYCPAGTATPDMLGGLNVAGTVSVGVTGQGLPLSVLNPYNVITQAIVTSGIFPSRG